VTTDGVVKRLAVKRSDGSIDLIEIEGIFYLEAIGHDTLIRTKKKALPIGSKDSIAGPQAAGSGICALPQGIHCQFKSRSHVSSTQIKRLRSSLRSPRQSPHPIARDRLENIRKVLGV
jgi:hypothetical protein